MGRVIVKGFRQAKNSSEELILSPGLRHKNKSLLLLFYYNRTSGLRTPPPRASFFRP